MKPYNKRRGIGRPVGFKMSERSKKSISKTKTGQKHIPETKEKISNSLKLFFETPEGRRHIKRIKKFMNGFWSSPEGSTFRESLSVSMTRYYDDNFR